MSAHARVPDETHTVIIGAGAAGLAAAAQLACAKHSVVILDARDRLGGRILTDRTISAPVPIELGAEFIHGESSAVMGWLSIANQAAIDASHSRWRLNDGKLHPANDGLQDLKRSFARIRPPRRDIPFAQFLERHRRSLPRAVRELARMMVEGFDAADASKISTVEVLDEWSGDSAADAPTFRPAQGYDRLIDSMRGSLEPGCTTLGLGTVVREVAWGKGHVSIEAQQQGAPVRIHASRAIVTLPLGVLQLPPASPHAVRFAPELRSKRRALQLLAAGPVIKVVMGFARPFWAELDDCRYRNAGFFFAPHAAFPTFWTSLPARSAVLVAWAAGPNAMRLGGRSKDELIATVIDSLRALFGRRVRYAALLESVSWHDWQDDPFACGAYSYVTAGGARARRTLAAPMENTLFFAGEAADTEGDAATVGGALQSGMRAARQVLESADGRIRRRSAH
jgi:monoamine oxidase